ncbi:MAG TPA: site-specific integrase, partial [Myxococcota bacterium]|nr:site-specific integrase [Myxococcota bacterium]
FSPYLEGRERRLFGDRGHGFESREHAQAILNQIQGIHGRGLPLSEAVGQYRRPQARPNLVSEKVESWIKHVETCGDYAPYTISDYRGFTKGHFAFWHGKSVYEIRYDELRAWIVWMRERKLGPKSIRNVLASFRAFYRWLRRGREQELPLIEFPSVKLAPREKARAMDLQDRAAAIESIPIDDRGIFIAMKMGIRPQEGRALRIGHYNFASGVVSIREALKGQGSGAARGETKTGVPGDYQVSDELRQWIAKHVPEARRFKAEAPLFANPRTDKPYSANRLRQLWIAACDAAEVDYVPLYRATKHSTFTALREAGVSRDDVQALARHTDPRTTDQYDLVQDRRRRRALDGLAELERRGRQTGARKKRVAELRKSP